MVRVHIHYNISDILQTDLHTDSQRFIWEIHPTFLDTPKTHYLHRTILSAQTKLCWWQTILRPWLVNWKIRRSIEGFKKKVKLVRSPRMFSSCLLVFTDWRPIELQFPVESSHQIHGDKFVLECLFIYSLNNRGCNSPVVPCYPARYLGQSCLSAYNYTPPTQTPHLSRSGSSQPVVASICESRKVKTSASAALIGHNWNTLVEI